MNDEAVASPTSPTRADFCDYRRAFCGQAIVSNDPDRLESAVVPTKPLARRKTRRESGYPLRSNIRGDDPGHLWRLYLQLVEIEQAFKELKNDLSIRPIHHQLEDRIEAHIFVAFLAYGLMVTLKQRLKALAPGLTPRAVLEKLAAIQMID